MSNTKEINKGIVEFCDINESLSICTGRLNIDLIPDYLTDTKSKIVHPIVSHQHAAYELFIVEAGKLTLAVERDGNISEITILPGQYILLAPKTPHKTLSSSNELRKFTVRFAVKEFTSAPPFAEPYICGEFVGDTKDLIFAVTRSLRRSSRSAETELESYRLKCQLLIVLSYILDAFQPLEPPVAPDSDSSLVIHEKIENYMYQNYSKPITFDFLSEHLSYSRTQLRRIIKGCFGMSFSEKLREIRLSAAKHYLSETKLPIDEIAEHCGYETRQGFEAMFLKYIGKTPNQYRNSQKK